MLSNPNFEPSLHKLLIEQSQSMFWGLCNGDSLGYRTEFLNQREILDTFGISGILEPGNPALITDDSQMSIALTKALCRSDLNSDSSIRTAIAEEFIVWSQSADTPERFPGRACMEACDKLARGISPEKSGGLDELGSGAAMRAAVIGYLFQNHSSRLFEVASLQARITHNNNEAAATSVAAALMTKFALDGLEPIFMVSEIADAIMPISMQASNQIRKIREVLAETNHLVAMEKLGQGFLGREAVALALYCMIKNPTSWIDTVRIAANYSGDSDTIACIAGGAQALRLGASQIPQDWIDRLERRTEINSVAHLLADKKLELLSRSA